MVNNNVYTIKSFTIWLFVVFLKLLVHMSSVERNDAFTGLKVRRKHGFLYVFSFFGEAMKNTERMMKEKLF